MSDKCALDIRATHCENLQCVQKSFQLRPWGLLPHSDWALITIQDLGRKQRKAHIPCHLLSCSIKGSPSSDMQMSTLWLGSTTQWRQWTVNRSCKGSRFAPYQLFFPSSQRIKQWLEEQKAKKSKLGGWRNSGQGNRRPCGRRSGTVHFSELESSGMAVLNPEI